MDLGKTTIFVLFSVAEECEKEMSNSTKDIFSEVIFFFNNILYFHSSYLPITIGFKYFFPNNHQLKFSRASGLIILINGSSISSMVLI